MQTNTHEGSWLSALRAIHDDEDGMETLQIVMIVGVAVVVLLLIVVFWGVIKGWATDVMKKWKSDAPKDPGSI